MPGFLGALAVGRDKALDRQQKDAEKQQALAFSTLLQGANIRHLNAESDKLAEPPQAQWTVHDTENGLVRVNGKTGEETPLVKPDGSPVMGPKKAPLPGSDDWKNAERYKASLRPDQQTPLYQIQGPNGEPVWATKADAVGQKAKVTTKVESATNTASKARLEAAISEMNNAHKGMQEFEEGLKSGKYKINGLEQLSGRVANSFTHDDPLSMTIQSGALATLNRTNPMLARYIRRGLSFAEGESMISQRPSDFRTKMAAFLSSAASGASPEMIADIESRRNSILNPLNSNVGTKSHDKPGDIDLGQPSKPETPTNQGHPSYEDWKKSKGHK